MRVMLTIVAMLAVAVTLVDSPDKLYLYFPAAALLLLVAIIWVSHAVRSKDRRKRPTQPPPLEHPEESLADVGILEIRAKTTEARTAERNTESRDASPEQIVKERGVEPEPTATIVRTFESPYTSLPDPTDGHVLDTVLEGFRVALGAHAVVAARRSDADISYQIIGTAGSDWAKNRGTSFHSTQPLLPPGNRIAIRRISPDDLPPQSLGYSSRPGLIKRLAVASVGTLPLVLLVDTTRELGLTHPRAAELVEHFAQTLSLLFYKEDPNRPRNEIIAEEIALARSQDQSLALALVLLNESESIAAAGQAVISRVEELLRERLQNASESSRVVRFGELMFGVFTDGRRQEIETWNDRIQTSIANDDGFLSSGVTIGIAVLDDQHQHASQLRSDAMQALLQAYESNTRTVVA